MSENLMGEMEKLHKMLLREKAHRGPQPELSDEVLKMLGLKTQISRPELYISEEKEHDLLNKIDAVRSLVFQKGQPLIDDEKMLAEAMEEGEGNSSIGFLPDAHERFMINIQAPDSPINFILADKRPLSSASPQRKLMFYGDEEGAFEFMGAFDFDDSFTVFLSFYSNDPSRPTIDARYSSPHGVNITEMTDLEHSFFLRYLTLIQDSI